MLYVLILSLEILELHGPRGVVLEELTQQLRTTVGLIPLRAALGLWEDGRCELLHRCSHLPTFGQKIPSGILQASQETSGTILPFPILVT